MKTTYKVWIEVEKITEAADDGSIRLGDEYETIDRDWVGEYENEAMAGSVAAALKMHAEELAGSKEWQQSVPDIEMVVFSPNGENCCVHWGLGFRTDWLYYEQVEEIKADPAEMLKLAYDLPIDIERENCTSICHLKDAADSPDDFGKADDGDDHSDCECRQCREHDARMAKRMHLLGLAFGNIEEAGSLIAKTLATIQQAIEQTS